MKSSIMQFLLGSLLLLSTACNRPDPNPELKDPIYAGLIKKHADYDREATSTRDKIPEIVERLSKAEARSIDIKAIQLELAKERATLRRAEQQARYYRIRAQRRKLSARVAYKKAFAAGKPWPDPREYSDYLLSTRLRETNLNWNTRVPKLHDRKPALAAKPEPPPGGGH